MAGFLGVSNLLDGSVDQSNDRFAEVTLSGGTKVRVPASRRVRARPECVSRCPTRKTAPSPASGQAPTADANALAGSVLDASYVGVSTQYVVDIGDGHEIAVYSQNVETSGLAEQLSPGERVRLTWKPQHTFRNSSPWGVTRRGGIAGCHVGTCCASAGAKPSPFCRRRHARGLRHRRPEPELGPTQLPPQPRPRRLRSSATATAGDSPTATAGSTASASPSVAPTETLPATPQPSIAGHVDWANWPLYIDIDDNGKYPTIKQFTEETGITVNYQESILDNSGFFGIIQPDLAANRSIGYDVITPSDWMVAKLIRLGYLQPLDKSLLPNWTANGQDLFKNPWYDPGNVYSVAWQSGIVGIGYNPKLTGREITKFDDLLDPAFKGNVGMFNEMIDTMSMTLLSLGIDPHTATYEDAQQAQQKLLACRRGRPVPGLLRQRLLRRAGRWAISR